MSEYERTEGRRKRSHSGAIALMITLMIMITASVGLLFLPDGREETKGKKPSPAAATPTPQTGNTKGEELLAVVLSVDTQIKTITLYDVKAEQEQTMVYTGATVFSDSFDGQLSAAQLTPGMLLYCTVDMADNSVLRAREPDTHSDKESVWEKQNVDNLTVTDVENRISHGERNYQYTDGICVMSNGKRISLDSVLPMDRVTLRGEGPQIYEILVTKGHGYLSLANHEDFVGGTVLIGGGMEFQVTEEAKYLVKEGTYKVTVTHGEYTGTKSITVARDETAVFDVLEYGSEPGEGRNCRLYD